MPLYEAVLQEKPSVVLDIGTAYTKLGFAAEAHPRKIIPTEVILSSTNKMKNIYIFNDAAEFYEQMVDFLQMIFFKYLLVSPKERKIVIVENVYGPTILRETLAKVLFRHFEVASILYVPSHLMSLSTLALANAVVVDIGYSETTVMPIFSGVQIMPAFRDQKFGGKLLHEEIKRQLVLGGVDEHLLTESILEDIKVRTCFVTNLKRARAYAENCAPEAPPTVEYPIAADSIITIPGSLRETVYEVLFEDSNERDNLPHIILKAILACPMDIRVALIENIYIVGGSAIVMGLLARLKEELLQLMRNDNEYKDKFHKLDDKLNNWQPFHKTVGPPNIAAWIGAALCAGTDLVNSRSLTKENYMRLERVPDWISLDQPRMAG